MKITRKTKIMNLVNSNPDHAELLFESGLGCIGCHMSQYETLEEGCSSHGFNDKEIDKLIDKLNEKKKPTHKIKKKVKKK